MALLSNITARLTCENLTMSNFLNFAMKSGSF